MKRESVKRGAYALVIRADKRTGVRIGRLGQLEFRRGFYAYVGSAMNSLPGRLSRYYTLSKNKHWHIDYLLHTPTFKPIGVAFKVTSRRIECKISQAVQQEALSSIKGFGCSDCDCMSHLHFFVEVSTVYRTLSQLGLDVIRRD